MKIGCYGDERLAKNGRRGPSTRPPMGSYLKKQSRFPRKNSFLRGSYVQTGLSSHEHQTQVYQWRQKHVFTSKGFQESWQASDAVRPWDHLLWRGLHVPRNGIWNLVTWKHHIFMEKRCRGRVCDPPPTAGLLVLPAGALLKANRHIYGFPDAGRPLGATCKTKSLTEFQDLNV